MKIWVDADSCPSKVKEILYRTAERRHIAVVLVADRRLRFPDSPYVSAIQVTAGMDAADTEIVQQMKQGDLVITADIPLAAAVINAAGHALNPRGELYTEENIRSRLSMRDFLDSLRQTGIDTGGPSALSQRDHKQFADELDRFLSRHAAG